jgi:hypothetical protein
MGLSCLFAFWIPQVLCFHSQVVVTIVKSFVSHLAVKKIRQVTTTTDVCAVSSANEKAGHFCPARICRFFLVK